MTYWLHFLDCFCGRRFAWEHDSPAARARLIFGFVWGGSDRPRACPDCDSRGWVLVPNDPDFLPEDLVGVSGF